MNETFFTKMDDVIKYMSLGKEFDVSQMTHVIDFADTETLTDPIVAQACVEVMTSDGQIGTLSHINVDNDVSSFVRQLKQLLKKDGVPVILVGGLETSLKSLQLIDDLITELSDAGFTIDENNCDLSGSYKRRSTMSKDGVLVLRQSLGTEEASRVRLSFPKQDLGLLSSS
jgi:hypothetical protein